VDAVVFDVDLPPMEVATRLSEVIATPRALGTLLSSRLFELPYIGVVATSGLSARRPGRNMLKVIVDGVVTPSEHGSRIAIRAKLPSRALVISAVVSLALVSLLSALFHEPGMALAVLAGAGLVGYVGVVQSTHEADEMTRILRGVCSSETVAAARSLGRTV